MDKYKSNKIRDVHVVNQAPAFVAFYKSLKSLLSVQEKKLLAKQSKQTTDSQTFTIPSTPTTPEYQCTHPRDPNSSGSSTQSKREDYTKDLLSMLLMSTLIVLDQGFQRLLWVQSPYEVFLVETSFPALMN